MIVFQSGCCPGIGQQEHEYTTTESDMQHTCISEAVWRHCACQKCRAITSITQSLIAASSLLEATCAVRPLLPPSPIAPLRSALASVSTISHHQHRCLLPTSPHTVAAPNHQPPVLHWPTHTDPQATHHHHRHHHHHQNHQSHQHHHQHHPEGRPAANSAAGLEVQEAGGPHTAPCCWRLACPECCHTCQRKQAWVQRPSLLCCCCT